MLWFSKITNYRAKVHRWSYCFLIKHLSLCCKVCIDMKPLLCEEGLPVPLPYFTPSKETCRHNMIAFFAVRNLRGYCYTCTHTLRSVCGQLCPVKELIGRGKLFLEERFRMWIPFTTFFSYFQHWTIWWSFFFSHSVPNYVPNYVMLLWEMTGWNGIQWKEWETGSFHRCAAGYASGLGLGRTSIYRLRPWTSRKSKGVTFSNRRRARTQGTWGLTQCYWVGWQQASSWNDTEDRESYLLHIMSHCSLLCLI